jgi:hypothetical protein
MIAVPSNDCRYVIMVMRRYCTAGGQRLIRPIGIWATMIEQRPTRDWLRDTPADAKLQRTRLQRATFLRTSLLRTSFQRNRIEIQPRPGAASTEAQPRID